MAMFDKAAATRDLDTLNGYGPGGSMNPAAGDGYFANSLERKWSMSIRELEKAADYRGVSARRARADRAYSEIMGEDDKGDAPVETRPHRAIKMRPAS